MFFDKSVDERNSECKMEPEYKNLEKILAKACRRGEYEMAEYILGCNVNVNAQAGLPLMKAAEHNHVDVAEVLIKYGADVNLSKGSALRLAAMYGHLEMAELLIKHGANINLNKGQEQLKVLYKNMVIYIKT